MPERVLQVTNLGRQGYAEAYARQKELVSRRIAGEIPDTLLLVEHPHVFTIGRGGSREHLLVSQETLAAEGIEVYEIDRGGDITYHGPGQIVGYPLLDLKEHGKDVHRAIHMYEEALIGVLAEFGVVGERDPRYPGVWVDGAKIAAIGIGIRRWVTFHGFAFNINPDLRFFQMIVPCGITDKPVTSLAAVLGRPVTPAEVKPRVAQHFAWIFSLTLLENTGPVSPQGRTPAGSGWQPCSRQDALFGAPGPGSPCGKEDEDCLPVFPRG